MTLDYFQVSNSSGGLNMLSKIGIHFAEAFGSVKYTFEWNLQSLIIVVDEVDQSEDFLRAIYF